MIVVIQTFVYPDAWTDHLLWGSILVLLLTRGPGAISADAVLAKLWSRRERRRAAAV
jgi:putative oxidoreductase